MKLLSKQEAQNKLREKYINDDFTLIEYNGYGKICSIHCNKCGKNMCFSQYGNVLSRGKNGNYLCECTKMENKQKKYEEEIKIAFPKEQVDILSFTGVKKPITVRCKKCGYIRTIQNASLLKREKHLCSRCHPNRFEDMESSKEKFIKFISASDKWIMLDKDISCIHAHDKVKCACKKCGATNRKTIYTYMKGIGCWNCCGNSLKTTDDFKSILDGDYQLLTEYKGSKEKILLKHNCGFVFSTTPGSYLSQGVRCPKCSRGTSKGEKRIIEILESLEVPYEREYPVDINGHMLRFDFYLPQQNLYIEFNGIQHYKQNCFNRSEQAFKVQIEHDNLKKEWCKNRLLVIPYTDYEVLDKKIRDFLGFND